MAVCAMFGGRLGSCGSCSYEGHTVPGMSLLWSRSLLSLSESSTPADTRSQNEKQNNPGKGGIFHHLYALSSHPDTQHSGLLFGGNFLAKNWWQSGTNVIVINVYTPGCISRPLLPLHPKLGKAAWNWSLERGLKAIIWLLLISKSILQCKISI